MKDRLFIAFEGIDGSGKSTQIKLVAEKLRLQGHKVHTTFEPTDGPIGTMIRNILKGESHADDRIIAGLFVADRLDHLLNQTSGILRKLEEGFIVLCDRYCFSSYAYQGTHMSMDWVIDANAMAASILKPHLNIFVDIEPAVSMQRIHRNRQTTELYETAENLERVRAQFFAAFDKLKGEENVAIVDGNRTPQVIAVDIEALLDSL